MFLAHGAEQIPMTSIDDDEKTTSETLTAIFRNRGYQARAAHSAEEAIDVIAEWQPDLALLDVNLPGMNGVDLAMVLRSKTGALRIPRRLYRARGGHHISFLPS